MIDRDNKRYISIHAPRVGCDPPWLVRQLHGWYFNPRTPCGVRPDAPAGVAKCKRFQSTHPVWGATPSRAGNRLLWSISIHAPRVGCDAIYAAMGQAFFNFNPRTPCGVRRPARAAAARSGSFQSTHPVWGATSKSRSSFFLLIISIHAPRVGCDIFNGQRPGCERDISIHAPRVGCDWRHFPLESHPAVISIHAPRVGCDDTSNLEAGLPLLISIHAPRVGCDVHTSRTGLTPCDFNPRTPCGVRRWAFSMPSSIWLFQSTHPVWGATRGAVQ